MCADRIKTIRLCVAILIASLFFCAPSFADSQGNYNQQTANTEAGTIQTASVGGNYSVDASHHGLIVPLQTGSFQTIAYNLCRYIDNSANGKGMLVPFKTQTEWQNFIANSWRSNQVVVDACRLPDTFPATVDFSPGITNPGALAESPVVTVAKPSIMRVDTSTQATLNTVAAQVETRSHNFAMSRTDCMGNRTYPDGSVRNPCTTWNWSQQVSTDFKYFFNGPTTVAAVQASAHNAAATEPGLWSNTGFNGGVCFGAGGVENGNGGAAPTPSVASCNPPVTAPTLRNCTADGHTQGQTYWVNVGTSNAPAACPAGTYNNGYTRWWTVQAQYECFDGAQWQTSYPTTITQEAPGSSYTTGSCLPITNGSCNNGVVWACNSGTPANGYSDGSYWRWQCLGQNTGYTDNCATQIPVCNNGSTWACWAGTPANGWSDGTYYRWQCLSGNQADTCAQQIPVNGSCNNGSTWACWSGNPDNGSDDGVYYRWTCDGIAGGGTDYCAQQHAYIDTRTVDMECDSNSYSYTTCLVDPNSVGLVSISANWVNSQCNGQHNPQSSYACQAINGTNFGGYNGQYMFSTGGLRANFHVTYQVWVYP